jgi:polyvinyl alcohol dehydrogenase (cytochrome)
VAINDVRPGSIPKGDEELWKETMMSRHARSVRSLALAGAALAFLSACASDDAPAPPAAAAAPELAAAPAGPHPGEEVYQKACASCHDNAEATKAPNRDTLARMTPGMIVNAMITGRMAAQASTLSSAEVSFVADYLSSATEASDEWIETIRCPAARSTPRLDATPSVATFGFDLRNSRQLSNAQAGLSNAAMKDMELAWAIAFPNVVTMRSQAAVVGSTLFVPVGENKNRVFAFDISDAAKPCIQWVWEGERTIRTSAGYGVRSDGKPIVVVGDLGGWLHAIDARTGARVWDTHIGLFEASMLTSTPVVHKDKVFAPVSQYEIMMGGVDTHLCCKTHGGVVAVDALTGRKVWEGRTMEEAQPVRDRGDGQMLWGPSGAPIWNSPSIDVKRNRLYVGTGEATSPPAHRNTNALLAFDLADGSIKWSHQATANDIFVVGCQPGSKGKNCVPASETVYRDVDFGASTILATKPDGKEIVLAGQKSGTVWAMDPDNGKVVWRTDLGTGGAMGGVHWGIAADDTHVYAPISNAGRAIPNEPSFDPNAIKPGIYALNLQTGKIDWSFHTAPDCGGDRRKFMPRCGSLYGMSGAPTIIGDYVVTGGLDGYLYALDRKTGALVWKYDTARAFEALNGVAGNGGTIDNASIIASNGLLIVNSGYGLFSQGAGNVMLAFRPKAS